MSKPEDTVYGNNNSTFENKSVKTEQNIKIHKPNSIEKGNSNELRNNCGICIYILTLMCS